MKEEKEIQRKARRKIYNKRYRERHKEEICKQRKEYYKKNKEAINKERKEYYKKNKEKVLAQHKKYREENKEKIRKALKKYRQTKGYNTERATIATKKLRIRKKQYLGGKCEKCLVDDLRVLQFHHINGYQGKHYTHQPPWKDIKNEEIQLLCANCHIITHIENKDLN